MNIIVLVPNVVRRYIASFPEVTNNAYKYFNYDHRVVDERVQRFDAHMPYKGPQDFSDMEYDSLVAAAQHGLNPVLAKYSKTVACEDALHLAIKSFNNGIFDGKINASRFEVLLGALKDKVGIAPAQKQAKKEEKKEKKVPEDTVVRPHILRQLGIERKDIPHFLKNKVQKGLVHLVKDKGKIKVKKN
jgi:hypothetical protein